jgi:hypothetical protein
VKDDIRPKGSVEVLCTGIRCRGKWWFWVDCLDPRLPDGPFICQECVCVAQRVEGEPQTDERALEMARARFGGSARIYRMADSRVVEFDFESWHDRKLAAKCSVRGEGPTWLDALDTTLEASFRKHHEAGRTS